MNELGVQPNNTTYSFLINMYTADGNLELALRYFHEMKSLGMMPTVKSIQNVVQLAAELSFPRLAIDIADWYESKSTKPLGKNIWLKCLAASAQEYYVSAFFPFPFLVLTSCRSGGWRDALLDNCCRQIECYARRGHLLNSPKCCVETWSN